MIMHAEAPSAKAGSDESQIPSEPEDVTAEMVRHLLDQPPALRCRRSKVVRLRNGSKEILMHTRCDSWLCPECAVALRRRWGTHLAVKMLQASGVLFVETSPPDGWGTQRKRLLRKGASWCRIGCPGSHGIVFASEPHRGEVMNDYARTIALLGTALRDVELVISGSGSRCRPVTTSDDWAPTGQPSKFRRIGFVHSTNPESLRDALFEMGIPNQIRPVDAAAIVWALSYDAPLDSPDRMAALDATLAGIGRKERQADLNRIEVDFKSAIGED